MNKAPSVFYFTLNRENPFGHGFMPLGVGKMIRLTEDGIYYAYSLTANPDGSFGAVNVIRHHVSRWTRPDRLGGSYDGDTVRLINWMQAAGLGGGPFSSIPGPLIYVNTGEELHDVDVDSKIVQKMILEAIGPERPDVPCATAVSPGGTIVEVVQDAINAFVRFDNEQVLELPGTCRLRPWVRPGYSTEAGSDIADLVPRYEYTWEQFLSFSDSTQRSVISEVLAIHTHMLGEVSVFPAVFLPKAQRSHVDHGGVAQSYFELSLPNRKPVLSQGLTMTNEMGVFDFSQDAFKAF